MDVRRSYDLVAARYAEELGSELDGKPLDRALLDALAALTSGVVLDAGCGPGHVAAHLARTNPVVGMDLSPRMCALAPVPACAGDLVALPFRSGAISAIVCFYAVIHLSEAQRAAAYAEFARVLRPGGHALIAFHVRDADTAAGQAKTLTSWWGHDVALEFRFLDPSAEARALASAGLHLVARLDRAPDPRVEHASDRCYLLVRAAIASGSGS